MVDGAGVGSAAASVGPCKTIVTIVGAGALGTLFAASLASVAEVRVLVRSADVAAAIARRGGIAIEGSPPAALTVTADARRAFDAADLAIVAVKAFATRAALEPLRDVVAAATAIVSLQNGIDAADDIAAALERRARIALAPTTEAAMSLEPGLARRMAFGLTRVGWAAGDARPGDVTLERYAATAAAGCLATEVVAPIEPFLWRKLVANAAINPTTALAGTTNGALLADPDLRERAARLAREAAAVARAVGIALPYDDPVAEVEAVMRATAPNRSSMLRDLECGRRTEIEAISGAILRHAARLGVAVPETQRAYDEVRARAKA